MSLRTEAEPSPFSPIHTTRRTDTVVGQLQALILERRLEPGDPLPAERELASLLGVSRNVLREALGVLGQRGLVTVTAGRGSFISTPGPGVLTDAVSLLVRTGETDLVDLCQARLVIEPVLAEGAARRRSSSDLVELGELLNRLEECGDDVESHIAADLEFHDVIARISGQTVLRALVAALREPVARGMRLGAAVPQAQDRSDEQHARVFQAIAAADGRAAAQAMREHLEFASEYLEQSLTPKAGIR